MTTTLTTIEPEISPTRPLGPWANGVLMSPDEFDRATEWDENFRYELVRGLLIVSPPADEGERFPNDLLGHWLRNYQTQHPQGKCLDDTSYEQTIATSNGRRRMDRAIWTGLGRRARPNIDVPTIAIEFVSDSSRDRRRDFVNKREEYAAIGVREYWIIDRFRRNMTVCRGGDLQVVADHETYQSDLLPGFELPLKVLLDEANLV